MIGKLGFSQNFIVNMIFPILNLITLFFIYFIINKLKNHWFHEKKMQEYE
jgi:hypothetical protein